MEEKKGPSENSFTIIWKIENSEYFFMAGYELYSPVVSVEMMEQTSWRLVLSRLEIEDRIYATIKREAVDNGPEKFDLHYDFEVTPFEESDLKHKSRSHAFQKDELGPPVLLYDDDPEINSCFTIKCIMKKNKGNISTSGQCIARTQIAGESFEFIGKVENCSSLKPQEKRTLKVLSSSEDEKIMTVDLIFKKNKLFSEIELNIIPAVEKSDYNCVFYATILDCTGNKTGFETRDEFTLQETKILTLYCRIDREKYSYYYFPNDSLSLLCAVAIQGVQSEEIEKIEYGIVSDEDGDKNACSSSYIETLQPIGESSSSYDSEFQNISNLSSQGKDTLSNPFPNIVDDLVSFYKKGILCDTKLQTATETFPAHTAILSARSPVFEAMFTSDMKEKIKECVHIDDIDSETVKRMLVFLYSDFLEELKWEDAKKLYFAADKYQILSLRHKCSVILKKNIDLSNCCELLLMADLHQDGDLKAAVQNYIERYDKQVFLSAQWRDMEKSHPLLAIDIFRAVHIKDS